MSILGSVINVHNEEEALQHKANIHRKVAEGEELLVLLRYSNRSRPNFRRSTRIGCDQQPVRAKMD
jgi:hypothetical protein